MAVQSFQSCNVNKPSADKQMNEKLRLAERIEGLLDCITRERNHEPGQLRNPITLANKMTFWHKPFQETVDRMC